jgi:hypothetical protein
MFFVVIDWLFEPVIPSPYREGLGIWGGGGDAMLQMLCRCGWLSMTFLEKLN